MKSFLRSKGIPGAVATLALAGWWCVAGKAFVAASGEHVLGKSTVEPMLDDSNGNTVFALEPFAPAPENSRAVAPLYAVVYPATSTVPAYELNCQPTNCDHLNVLPFADSDYGVLPGTDQACVDFNGGVPCSPVKGHDHLIGVASTHGDFNVAWHVQFALFTAAAFTDGAINTRVTTLSQLQALVKSGDVFIADTPITFLCALTSERTYELGTPEVIPYP